MAADQGDVYSQIFLGHLYSNGEGAEKNLEAAVKYYRMAAEQGNADA